MEKLSNSSGEGGSAIKDDYSRIAAANSIKELTDLAIEFKDAGGRDIDVFLKLRDRADEIKKAEREDAEKFKARIINRMNQANSIDELNSDYFRFDNNAYGFKITDEDRREVYQRYSELSEKFMNPEVDTLDDSDSVAESLRRELEEKKAKLLAELDKVEREIAGLNEGTDVNVGAADAGEADGEESDETAASVREAENGASATSGDDLDIYDQYGNIDHSKIDDILGDDGGSKSESGGLKPLEIPEPVGPEPDVVDLGLEESRNPGAEGDSAASSEEPKATTGEQKPQPVAEEQEASPVTAGSESKDISSISTPSGYIKIKEGSGPVADEMIAGGKNTRAYFNREYFRDNLDLKEGKGLTIEKSIKKLRKEDLEGVDWKVIHQGLYDYLLESSGGKLLVSDRNQVMHVGGTTGFGEEKSKEFRDAENLIKKKYDEYGLNYDGSEMEGRKLSWRKKAAELIKNVLPVANKNAESGATAEGTSKSSAKEKIKGSTFVKKALVRAVAGTLAAFAITNAVSGSVNADETVDEQPSLEGVVADNPNYNVSQYDDLLGGAEIVEDTDTSAESVEEGPEELIMPNGVRYAKDAYYDSVRDRKYDFTNKLQGAYGDAEAMKSAMKEAVRRDPMYLVAVFGKLPDSRKGTYSGKGDIDLAKEIKGDDGAVAQSYMLAAVEKALDEGELDFFEAEGGEEVDIEYEKRANGSSSTPDDVRLAHRYDKLKIGDKLFKLNLDGYVFIFDDDCGNLMVLIDSEPSKMETDGHDLIEEDNPVITPADEENPPADEENPPADEENPPADEENPPADEENPPADEENPPADEENPPADEPVAPEAKDAENMERIDKQINEDVAENNGTEEIVVTPTENVREEEGKATENPVEIPDGYGTEYEEFEKNEDAEAAEVVSDTQQPGNPNNTTEDLGDANDGEYKGVEGDADAQAAADEAAAEIAESVENMTDEEFEDALNDILTATPDNVLTPDEFNNLTPGGTNQ